VTPWERYFAVGRRAGCPMDQMDRFQAADVILQSRQLAASAAARLCDRADGPTAVGYGGARGGGKSHWLLAQMGVDDCQRAGVWTFSAGLTSLDDIKPEGSGTDLPPGPHALGR